MLEKQRLGQFFSKQAEYLFQGFVLPPGIHHIIEPFAGDLDLGRYLQPYLKKNLATQIDYYDIAPRHSTIVQQDTLQHPPSYQDAWVVTNPPFLARNHNPEKTLYQKYQQNDLYKCFMVSLIEGNCQGAMLIIPLNFWSSCRQSDVVLRKRFLDCYRVYQLNVFEERVFEDTSYTVCSFICEKHHLQVKQGQQDQQGQQGQQGQQTITTTIYPSTKHISLCFSNPPILGLEIYQLPTFKTHQVSRATLNNLESPGVTNIVIKCIDDSLASPIRASYVEPKNRYIDTTVGTTRRSYLTLVVEPPLDASQQKKLVVEFNKLVATYRKKYHSLFLTNYRESKDLARKRISFQLVFHLCSYLIPHL
jgi:hypothetical protein